MTSYRVAVCEDDARVGEDLARRLREIYGRWNVEAEVQLFASADALLALYESGAVRFDLFLLDIQMQGTDGLTLAQKLYNDGVRDRVIFITGYAKYALAGYDAHPLHYLLKPVSDEALQNALQMAWSLHSPQSIVLQKGKRLISLPLADIDYIESHAHTTIFYLRHETRSFNVAISDVQDMLPPDTFVRCHRSYLVNLAQVDEITPLGARLRSGCSVPVSRTYIYDLQRAFVSWLNQCK